MGRRTSPTIQRIRDRLAVGILRLMAWLPLRLNRAVGRLVGAWLWRVPGDSRNVTEVNLRLCRPELSARARAQLARRSLSETGKGMVELGWLWHHPDRALELTRDGASSLEETLAEGRSVVILAPHLGAWEVLNFWLSRRFDMHVMFMPSGLQRVDRLVRLSRERFGSTMYPASPRGVAGLCRALKCGATLTAILPDQVADRRGGRFAPFFGQSAWTATLAPKLIQQSGARAFMAFARRLPGAEGFEIVLRDPDPELYFEDLDVSLAALNRSIEALIQETPEQYLWSYKRFRRAPKDHKNPYS